jgi:hypothetical protein
MRWFRLFDAAGIDIFMDGPEAFGDALREPPRELDTPALLHHIRRSPPRSLTRLPRSESRTPRPARKVG